MTPRALASLLSKIALFLGEKEWTSTPQYDDVRNRTNPTSYIISVGEHKVAEVYGPVDDQAFRSDFASLLETLPDLIGLTHYTLCLLINETNADANIGEGE